VIRAFFGGSFDPIHAGHVAIVELLFARGLADRVHVVPAGHSPLKRRAAAAPALVRLQLVELALAGVPQVEICADEVCREGRSYTVDTLTDLVARHPDARWRLVIGADQAAAFAHWHQPQRLLALAEPVVVARGRVTLDPLLDDRALVIADFAHPASATGIRRALAAGRMPGPELLPPAVAARIRTDGLYGFPAGAAPA
jgi:nicotinate-nucleotide adenylyltransferase